MFPTRILLATDGSGEASLAAQAAVELANGTHSELHVVHVVHTIPEMPILLAPRQRNRARLCSSGGSSEVSSS